MNKLIKNKTLLYSFCFLLVISCFNLLGVYNGHDHMFHLSRVQSIADGLKNGTFPVFIYPNCISEYGYGSGLFYPDLFLYIPSVFVALGVKLEVAYACFIALINIWSYISMYICIDTITNNKLSACSFSSLFVLSPYFISDAYIRSALGEHLAFSFMPLVIAGIYGILNKNRNQYILFTIGICGIFFSHILSALICAIVVSLFGILNIKKIFFDKDIRNNFLVYGFIAIGICSIFLFPFIDLILADQYRYQFNTYNILNNALTFKQIFIEYNNGEYKYAALGLGVVFLYLLIFFNEKLLKTKNKVLIQCILIGLIFAFLSSYHFPWGYISALDIIQFPWRFLMPSTVCLVVGFSGYMNEFIESNKQKLFVLSLIPFVTFTLFCFTKYYNISNANMSFNTDFYYKISKAEYLPIGVGESYNLDRDTAYNFAENRGTNITSNNELEFEFIKVGSSITINYSNNNNDNTYLDLPLIYYKGYRASDSGNNLTVSKSDEGLVRIFLQNQNGEIKVSYSYTKARILGIITTALTIIFLIYKEKYLKK